MEELTKERNSIKEKNKDDNAKKRASDENDKW